MVRGIRCCARCGLCLQSQARAAADAEERDQREKMAAMTPAQRRIYMEHLEQERKEAEWNNRE